MTKTGRPKDVLPVKIPREEADFASLQLGDEFTMEVPCCPDTGALSIGHPGAVLRARRFRVVEIHG